MGELHKPPHEVLGVSFLASLEEVEIAYKAKAKMHHPDVGGTHDAMVEVNLAYEELRKTARPATKKAPGHKPPGTDPNKATTGNLWEHLGASGEGDDLMEFIKNFNRKMGADFGTPFSGYVGTDHASRARTTSGTGATFQSEAYEKFYGGQVKKPTSREQAVIDLTEILRQTEGYTDAKSRRFTGMSDHAAYAKTRMDGVRQVKLLNRIKAMIQSGEIDIE